MSAPATDIRDGAFLAIWSDVAPEIETDYLHWLTREHTQERLSVPGFLGVRVFRALHVPMCRYFILYALRDEAVVASPAYLARLNAPTPWTQRIMPQLQNFARAGGRKVAQFGSGAACDTAVGSAAGESRAAGRDRSRRRCPALRNRRRAHRDPHQ